MSSQVDHYNSQYGNFITNLYAEIRKEAFKNDIGQNGWITAEEQDMFIDWLNLQPGETLLDIACGSGGPTLRIVEKTNCSAVGIDINEKGIEAANKQKEVKGLASNARFLLSDGGVLLPFEQNTFDAITCIDAINHLPDRPAVLQEWYRILKPGGKLLFTDPITVTGVLSKQDIEVRASIGYFLFVADGVDAQLLKNAGFKLVKKENRTINMATMARKWQQARARRANELTEAEGRETFEGQQNFFDVCARLAEDSHLSRFAYLAIK